MNEGRMSVGRRLDQVRNLGLLVSTEAYYEPFPHGQTVYRFAEPFAFETVEEIGDCMDPEPNLLRIIELEFGPEIRNKVAALGEVMVDSHYIFEVQNGRCFSHYFFMPMLYYGDEEYWEDIERERERYERFASEDD